MHHSVEIKNSHSSNPHTPSGYDGGPLTYYDELFALLICYSAQLAHARALGLSMTITRTCSDHVTNRHGARAERLISLLEGRRPDAHEVLPERFDTLQALHGILRSSHENFKRVRTVGARLAISEDLGAKLVDRYGPETTKFILSATSDI